MSAGVGEADLCLVRNISRRLRCPRHCLSGVRHERHHRPSPAARVPVPVPVPDGSVLPSVWEWSSRAARLQEREREQVPVGVRRLEPVQVQVRGPVRFELPGLGLGQH